MKQYSRTLKIGFLTILALAFLIFGIKFLKGINLFSSENAYYAYFKNVTGVTVSTPVYIEGFKVGVVRDMSFDYETNSKVRVKMSINKKVRLPKNSLVRIKQNPLSGANIIVELGSGKPIAPNGVLQTIEQPADLMFVAQEKILPMINRLMPQIDSLVRGLNQQVNNPDIAQAIGHIRNTAQQIDLMAEGMRKMSTKIPPIIDKMDRLTDDASVVAQNLREADLKRLMAQLQATVDNLQTVSQQLKQNEGTAGKLLNDPTLYHRIDSIASGAEKLLKDIKENPSRYVHFSVF